MYFIDTVVYKQGKVILKPLCCGCTKSPGYFTIATAIAGS